VWRDISAAYPEAPVLLSTRSSSDAWWRSARDTIFVQRDDMPDEMLPWRKMSEAMFERISPDRFDETVSKAAYERHNAEVRAEVPPERLIDWRPEDGWAPICEALGFPVPDEPFPHTNTTAEFRGMTGLDS
jgi:hypothetical protein